MRRRCLFACGQHLSRDEDLRQVLEDDRGLLQEQEGPLEALAMAARTLKPGAKPVAHSDRGCQYASRAYREALGKLGWRSGMTEEFHCYENAMAERLNGILKHEYFLDAHFKTKKEAVKAIGEAIRVYNTRRLHEKCGYKTPTAFREEAMRKAARGRRRPPSPWRVEPPSKEYVNVPTESTNHQEPSVNLEP